MKSEMKRLVLIIMLLVLTVLASAMLPTSSIAQYSACGFKPFKPMPSVGCKDHYAECVCDEKGKNCHWVWICVPR